MDFGDVVRIAILLMIVSYILWRRRGRKAVPGSGLGGIRPARRPTVLSESGGYERSFPQPPTRRALRTDFGSRPGLAESRQARQEAIARGLGTGSMPTAEEQPRRTREPTTAASPATPPPRATHLRQQLMSSHAVRDAFALSEVLDRPVGLRENP